jgi:hypothetical protein
LFVFANPSLPFPPATGENGREVKYKMYFAWLFFFFYRSTNTLITALQH